MLKETLDIDGRASRTFRTLLMQPGVLTSEYLAGRRKSYTHPLRLYLVISVSFFLLVAWLASQGVLLDPGQTRELDAEPQAQFMADELPRLMFVLLPIFALLIKIVFPRRLYFDHIIFSIHLHSAAYGLLAPMMLLGKVASEHWLPLAAQISLLCYFLGYFAISLRRVYGGSWIVASAKSLAILFGYLIVISGVIEATSNIKILAD